MYNYQLSNRYSLDWTIIDPIQRQSFQRLFFALERACLISLIDEDDSSHYYIFNAKSQYVLPLLCDFFRITPSDVILIHLRDNRIVFTRSMESCNM